MIVQRCHRNQGSVVDASRDEKRNAGSVEATTAGIRKAYLSGWLLARTVVEVVSATNRLLWDDPYFLAQRTSIVYGPWIHRRSASQLPMEVQ